jgi:hypothetical protein
MDTITYDDFHPNNNRIEDLTTNINENTDPGFCKILRKKLHKNKNKIKNVKLDVYVSGNTGSRIRDAVSGHFYDDFVGSHTADNYFRVSLATGEVTAKNGLNTLYYISPRSYEEHMNTTLPPDVIRKWEEKRINSQLR